MITHSGFVFDWYRVSESRIRRSCLAGHLLAMAPPDKSKPEPESELKLNIPTSPAPSSSLKERENDSLVISYSAEYSLELRTVLRGEAFPMQMKF